ncbi:hypothetical protein [Maritalea myrionectae]|uniref:hypothetical protein n=1 Tax=Maritalea myrionectae TaxID=454601 RepID=UPI000482BC67|nr:hypothetical protein [Maritalea myrionectae]
MPRLPKIAFILAVPFLLVGCMSLNTLGTIQTMSKLDVVNDPIEDMVFAVEADANLKPLPEQTQFVFSLTPEGGTTQKTRANLRLAAANEMPRGTKPAAQGKILHVFVFPEAEKEKLRAVQAQIRTFKSKSIKGSLSIGVEPAFCKTTPQVASDSKFSVFVARSTQESLMPLLAGAKVSDLENKTGQNALPMCH